MYGSEFGQLVWLWYVSKVWDTWAETPFAVTCASCPDVVSKASCTSPLESSILVVGWTVVNCNGRQYHSRMCQRAGAHHAAPTHTPTSTKTSSQRQWTHLAHGRNASEAVVGAARDKHLIQRHERPSPNKPPRLSHSSTGTLPNPGTAASPHDPPHRRVPQRGDVHLAVQPERRWRGRQRRSRPLWIGRRRWVDSRRRHRRVHVDLWHRQQDPTIRERHCHVGRQGAPARHCLHDHRRTWQGTA